LCSPPRELLPPPPCFFFFFFPLSIVVLPIPFSFFFFSFPPSSNALFFPFVQWMQFRVFFPSRKEIKKFFSPFLHSFFGDSPFFPVIRFFFPPSIIWFFPTKKPFLLLRVFSPIAKLLGWRPFFFFFLGVPSHSRMPQVGRFSPSRLKFWPFSAFTRPLFFSFPFGRGSLGAALPAGLHGFLF